MTTRITTLIEQFSVVDGNWRSSPHNQVAVREPKRGKRGKGNLFVLVEALGNTSKLEEIERRLVALVRDTYYPASGGITASLRRAVQAGNAWLFQQNNATTPDKQVIAGVIAVVIKDDDFFVAQCGPTALYSSLGHIVERYPKSSSWLDSTPPDVRDIDDPILGAYHYVDPRVTHLQIAAADVVVLANGYLAKQLDPAEISQVLQGTNIEAISQNLAGLIRTENGSAMIIQVISEEGPGEAFERLRETVPVRIDAGEGRGFNVSIPAILSGPMSAIAPKSPPKQHRAVGHDQPPHEAISYSDAPYGDAPYDDAPYEDTFYEDDEEWAGSTRRFNLPDISVSDIVHNVRTGALAGIAFLGSGLQTVIRLVLPGTQADPTVGRRGAARPFSPAITQPSTAALKYVAIGLPILIIVVTLLVVWFRGYSQETEYTTFVTEAQQKFAQAQSADPQTAATLLAQAENSLVEASVIKENQPEVTALQASIAVQRDELGNVERLYYLPELQRYTDPGTQLNRIIIQGAEIYVLDTGLDRLYRHTLDDLGDTLLPQESNPLLLQRGQDLGGTPVGDIIDMVWMPAAGGRQTSDLLILTREGLLEFNSDWGASPIAISSSDLWQSPVAVSSYFGNFYLLDPQANLLLRYWPTANGYENPAESYFPDSTFVDLSGAVDMAIDGHIYVLYQDGQIKKFLGGEPAPFQLTGLDIPFNNPAALYTASDEQIQHLYVADAGNRRIVQLTKDGQFVRQFKPRLEDNIEFDDLRSLYVDEISEKMFILNGSSLYAPNIPAN